MSSISVLWNHASDPPAESMVASMLAAQAMYGPHKSFSTCVRDTTMNGRIALAGNLMNLLPEDRFDQQPIWNADRSACLVADVRLDNRGDLARELALVHPEQMADSTILMAAWTQWGSACLDHIVGGFAFAVWTPARQELFAARDHAGERPLFYHRADRFFALASMPKGLLALPGMFRGFDEQRVIDGLVHAHPDWHTSYYKGIARLPLGHFLRVTPDSFVCEPFWHPCDAKPTRFRRDEEYVDAFVDLFDKATEARLRSPRAIGAHLSSGLDSSSVAATAARILAPHGKGLTAFTSVPRDRFLGKGLPGRLLYEGPGAAEVAAMYPNIEHVQMDSEGYDLLEDTKAWTDAMDEPAINCVNLLWIWAIMAEAKRRDIGVILQGTAGNATFSFDGGEAMTTLFRTGRWLKLLKLANNLRNRAEYSFKASALVATNGLLPMWMKAVLKPAIRSTNLDFTPVHPQIIAQQDLLNKTVQRLHGDDPDIRTYRALFFERFDPAPMNAACQARAGMDTRDPTADKRIFEYCFSLPIEQYAAGAQSRSLARRSMKDRLPRTTLERTIRGQQGADWYLTVEEALPSYREELPKIEQSPAARQFLDLERIKTLLATWPDKDHDGQEVTSSWNYSLTRAISTGYLFRKYDAPDARLPLEAQAPASP